MKLFAGMLQGPRRRQEDCLVIGDHVLQEARLALSRIETNCLAGIAAISDGMGGAPDGQWASFEACRFLSRLSNALAYCDALPAIIEALQGHLCSQAQSPQCGATLTGVIFRPDEHATIIHLGDSRAYLKQGDKPLRQITIDHNPVMDKVMAGELTGAEATDHPLRNIVDLGVGPAFGPNWEQSAHQPQVTDVDLMPGDRLIITSDGFHNAATLQDLDKFVAAFDPAHPEELFMPFARKVDDNASVILLQA